MSDLNTTKPPPEDDHEGRLEEAIEKAKDAAEVVVATPFYLAFFAIVGIPALIEEIRNGDNVTETISSIFRRIRNKFKRS